MELSKALFLARYYVSNAVFSKLGGQIAKRTVSSQSERWQELRTAHAEHDAWLVVGNGPSLTSSDLEALAHLPAVASNKITLLYEHTKWRPTLYTVADPLLLFKLPASHYEAVPLALLPHGTFHMARTPRKLAWQSVPLARGETWFERTRGTPDPVRNGLIAARTVTTANIQLAMWCGAKTIYLIGCDHNYQEEKHAEVTKLEHTGESNHFHPDYRKPGEVVNNAPTTMMDRGYALLRRVADHQGVRIINITRRTALQAYQRGTVEGAVKETGTDDTDTLIQKTEL